MKPEQLLLMFLLIPTTTAFEILYSPENATNNAEFRIFVLVENNDKIPHNYSMHSYLYRGSKCYSGEREGNMVNFSLENKKMRVLEQRIAPDISEEGGYKVMIKLKKENDKSWNSVSRGINITIPKVEPQAADMNTNCNYTEIKAEKVIYESATTKALNLAPLLFMIACSAFAAGVLFWKKT